VKMLNRIASEWNQNAAARCRQIAEHKDISHDKVLIPAIVRLAAEVRGKNVLDIGCGCGYLAAKIGRSAKSVLGIDISQKMIEQATLRHATKNVSFMHVSIETLAVGRRRAFDLCLSNMSVITMPDLRAAFEAVRNVLRPEGRFVFSIAHPCFWNVYRHDESQSGFDYWCPHSVIAPFRITMDRRPLPARTTYFHRPLSFYCRSLRKAGFRIEDIDEPTPPKGAPSAYLASFKVPRFLVFGARRS
jgi:SAM-dependent methyltransferase